MAEFNPEIDNNSEDENNVSDGRINCIRCAFYEVTWDLNSPHGCIMFGFKGKRMPSEVVRETTGKTCPSFKLKIKK